MLRAEHLVAGYEPGLPIVRGVDAHVQAGEIVALLGPNGAGKSTLARAMAGLVPIAGGRVRLDGTDITTLPAHAMVRRGFAFVPQTGNVFAGLTVADNLALAAAVLPRARRAGRGAAMLELFPDLVPLLHGPAGRLSGGQRQMLAIARAMLTAPRAIALDEPSAGLSPRLVGVVMDLLRRIRDAGVAVLLVEQNARAALAVADRAAVLVEGRIAHQGPAASLLRDTDLGALYLGRRAA